MLALGGAFVQTKRTHFLPFLAGAAGAGAAAFLAFFIAFMAAIVDGKVGRVEGQEVTEHTYNEPKYQRIVLMQMSLRNVTMKYGNDNKDVNDDDDDGRNDTNIFHINT